MAVMAVEVAKVQGGISDVIRQTTIGMRRICGSDFTASSKSISLRPA